MLDRDKIREEQRDLVRRASAAAKLAPSALAPKLGIRPSTLTRVLGEKYTHLLSASTVALLEGVIADPEPFRPLPAAAKGSFNVDPKIASNLLDSPENQKLLGLWIGMDTSTKLATLDILEAVTRIARRKAG